VSDDNYLNFANFAQKIAILTRKNQQSVGANGYSPVQQSAVILLFAIDY
jgi:hypothetical protein